MEHGDCLFSYLFFTKPPIVAIGIIPFGRLFIVAF